MKFRFLLTSLALLLCIGLSAQATERAKNRAKNRAENRANSKVDQKVDSAVDDAFNAIGGLFKKKNKKKDKDAKAESAPTGAAEAPANYPTTTSGPWQPYTNPVSFSMTMAITEVKNNGKRQQNAIDMAVTSNEFAIRMVDEEVQEVSRMILSTQDGKSTVITTDKKGNKTGFRMRMPGMRKAMVEAAEEVDSDRFTFTQTGERKTIDGYDCEKIIVVDHEEDITTESWVTQDLDMTAQDVFSGMMGMFGAAKQKKNGPANALAGPYTGFPIMSTTYDDKQTFETHFKDIKVGADKMDRTILDTSGVTIQSVGF
ncbi:MAG: DUF4412 domain-containing protein [Bacteroidota bacterium]